MLGKQKKQEGLFCYGVRLEDRVPENHPLRSLKRVLDLSFVREAVASFYGYNGNVSVAPEVIVKLMLLLFLDDIGSERELMRTLPYRLDYLWFLDFGLDDEIPNHSVLSKARSRWPGLWRQKIQDYLIACCQNLRILIASGTGRSRTAMIRERILTLTDVVDRIFHHLWVRGIGFWPRLEIGI